MERWAKNIQEPLRSDAWLWSYCSLTFLKCADISIYCRMQYLHNGKTEKKVIQQFCSCVHILFSYQIYFHQLLCFQEMSLTEFQSSHIILWLNPYRLLKINNLFLGNGTILKFHIILNCKLDTSRSQMIFNVAVCTMGTLNSSNNALFCLAAFLTDPRDLSSYICPQMSQILIKFRITV